MPAGGRRRRKPPLTSSAPRAQVGALVLLPRQAGTALRRAASASAHHGLAILVSLRPGGSSEDPEDPDYFDDVDYAEEKDKDNTPVCELQVRTWCTNPSA
ncbi:unnamed protein product [Urochloa humidicola]